MSVRIQIDFAHIVIFWTHDFWNERVNTCYIYDFLIIKGNLKVISSPTILFK